MALSMRTLDRSLTAARVVGLEATFPRLIGQRLVGLGNGLTGRLLEMMLAREIAIWLNSPLKDLVIEHGRVVSAVVEREGKRVTIRTRAGVMLASAGFERNAEMRRRYAVTPILLHRRERRKDHVLPAQRCTECPALCAKSPEAAVAAVRTGEISVVIQE